jgi:LPS export ABC transporter protein LptC
MTAPMGRIDTKTHAMEAWGGVALVTRDSATLTTERLHYDAQNRRIYTQARVRIERPDSSTDGTGLETDPELKRITIGRQRVRLKER